MIQLSDIQAALGRITKRHPRLALHAFRNVLRPDAELDLPQARQPATHGRIQRARRAQQTTHALQRRALPRSDRGLGRKSRARGRLPCRQARGSCAHRHALANAADESVVNAGLRSRSRVAWRQLRRSLWESRRAEHARTSDFDSCVRRRCRNLPGRELSGWKSWNNIPTSRSWCRRSEAAD